MYYAEYIKTIWNDVFWTIDNHTGKYLRSFLPVYSIKFATDAWNILSTCETSLIISTAQKTPSDDADDNPAKNVAVVSMRGTSETGWVNGNEIDHYKIELTANKRMQFLLHCK